MRLSLPAFRRSLVCAVSATAILLSGAVGIPATAAASAARPPVGAQLESLDRGLVAARTSEGIFLSWRLLGQEVTGHGSTGMTGPAF